MTFRRYDAPRSAVPLTVTPSERKSPYREYGSRFRLEIINTFERNDETMDIKAIAEQLAGKIKGDDKLLDKFKSKPEDTVKKLLSKEVKAKLDGDAVKSIVEIIKTKLGLDGIAGIASKIGGLFGKK